METSKPSFKILMLGDAGVGKTCLVNRFSENRFTGFYKMTIGMDATVKDIEIAGNKVKLEIWDTAGEERYRSLMSMYYRKVDGIVLVFDTTRRQSYLHVDYWLDEIAKKELTDSVAIILVGNKCDAYKDRQVSSEVAAMYAECLRCPYFEASAISGCNVVRLFYKIAVKVFEQRGRNKQIETIPRGIRLTDEKNEMTQKNAAIKTRPGDFCFC